MLAEIKAQKTFTGSTGNLYAKVLEPDCYVIYSYGPHRPIAACIDDHWFLSLPEGSATTRRHIKKVGATLTNPTTVTLEELQARIKRFQEN